MTYVDSVSVIMAMCPGMFLQVLVSTTEKSTNKWQRPPSELLLAFTVPCWTTRGIRYGSPCCPVVVGATVDLNQVLGTPAQQASKVLSSVS